MNDKPVGKMPDVSPIEWEAAEFETHQRGAIWYVAAAIILILALVLTLYLRHWILSAVVVMVGVILYLSSSIRPRKLRYRIDASGIAVGGKAFGFDQLKAFWFVETPTGTTLNLISTLRLMPVISIRIEGTTKEKIRAVLAQVLPESRNKGEDWIDRINRLLRV
ncbi:hypothetical protein A2V68_00785 [candidate division Kazan bacterium RBG_13_50_9]|uniref:DUF5673 domain-containing protein n=1 Tax=candidate division Kazan bacterium RBG_13_50_9 TaxID=1798535 RepID=A0A1F4NS16_UNCK3|nr:MAG: hypothetical protein A2V68_00785 [candidate division Kazan bacterium RBG_13_50_9]